MKLPVLLAESKINTSSVPIFFIIKIITGLILLKASALFLNVTDFAIFAQFLLFIALINMLVVGGVQNGVVRQTAAAVDISDIAEIRAGAFIIWFVAIFVVCIPAIVFRQQILLFLGGHTQSSWAISWIVILIFLSGPGQIYCSILTGLGRTGESLLSQGLGLLAGSLMCLYFIMQQQLLYSVISFSGGSIITLIFSFIKLKSYLMPSVTLKDSSKESRILLKYSGSFVILAVFSSLTLFGLRFFYKQSFGTEQLGYWLVASRISDTSTQLLGLFMVQLFLPRYASEHDPLRARKLIIQSWGAATAILLGFLGCFAIAPAFFVGLLLSDQYLPAINDILIYMVGDVLRVSASLAMHAAFARGSLSRYIGIEIATVSLFAALTVGLILIGNISAPMIGYVSAYAIATFTLIFYYYRTQVNHNKI